MINILYYDCFAGISGDMNLAAMIDLGVEPDYLKSELDKLGLGDEFDLVVADDVRNGITGTRVDVQLNEHHHEDVAAHSHHHHRNLSDIEKIIRGSGLVEKIKDTSLKIFRKVAEAEARVHGKSIDEVHFHEVGATDSIVDIVGAAICFHRLDVDAVWASSIELGSGFVNCAHGVMPVPAPATVEILHNIPTTRGGTNHEATTPTGAAIVAALVDKFIDTPAMATNKTGYGIGHRETEIPNVLRVQLAATKQSHGFEITQGKLLQCNIDDMTGEMLGDVMGLLMDSGAMDVHFSPISMKKNRPATLISLLCSEADENHFKDLLFRHTSTLGVKSFPLEKTTLERRFDIVETSLGPVTVKRAILNGEVVHSKPEYEECKELSRHNGIPLSEVYAIISRNE